MAHKEGNHVIDPGEPASAQATQADSASPSKPQQQAYRRHVYHHGTSRHRLNRKMLLTLSDTSQHQPSFVRCRL